MDETDIAFNAGIDHLKSKHEDWAAVPVSCGAGSYACPLCDWQILVEITGGAS